MEYYPHVQYLTGEGRAKLHQLMEFLTAKMNQGNEKRKVTLVHEVAAYLTQNLADGRRFGAYDQYIYVTLGLGLASGG